MANCSPHSSFVSVGLHGELPSKGAVNLPAETQRRDTSVTQGR